MLAAVISPRPWQKIALSKATVAPDKTFFLHASVGSGKTLFSLFLSQQLNVDRVLVTVPTQGIATAWESDSALMEIGARVIESTAELLRLKKLPKILILTTSLLMRTVSLLAELFEKEKWLLVTDESHHITENNSWGAATKILSEIADYRLAISGTPSRQNAAKILNLLYGTCPETGDQTGISSFTYTYQESLNDGHVTEIECRYDSDPIEAVKSGVKINFSFLSNDQAAAIGLTKKEARGFNNKTLRRVVKSKAYQIRTLQKADEYIEGMRNKHSFPYAGIVFCKDQNEARKTHQFITKSMGRKSVLIISGNKESGSTREQIAEVNSNPDVRFIVSVKKVAEGVSVDKLIAGIYLTNVLSAGFIHQVMGRLSRIGCKNISPSEQSAVMFFPAHPHLIDAANQFQGKVVHEISKDDKARIEQEEKQWTEKQKHRVFDPAMAFKYFVESTGFYPRMKAVAERRLNDFIKTQYAAYNKGELPAEQVAFFEAIVGWRGWQQHCALPIAEYRQFKDYCPQPAYRRSAKKYNSLGSC
jgi:superfamily II DNA or RNA helicase